MSTQQIKDAVKTLATMPRTERAKLTEDELEALGITKEDLDFDTEEEETYEEEPDSEDESEEDKDPQRESSDKGKSRASPRASRTASPATKSAAVVEDLSSLTKAQKELLDYLDEVNGQDAYSNEDAALGKVSKREYLVLPRGFEIPRVLPKDVGSPTIHTKFTKKTLAEIYVLNKAAAPEGSDATKFGLLRMEAVKMGWVAGQREIRRETAPTDALNTFMTDLTQEKENLGRFRRAAFLVPLVAEHTFRTMGHHYLTGDAAAYEKRYKDTLRACLAEDVHGILSAGVQYHALFHWVTPERARNVLMAQLSTTRIPDALEIRANAAPAGTALVTTSAAVISALKAANLMEELATAGGFDFMMIQNVTTNIKANPTAYHKTYYAYGMRALSTDARNELDRAKEEASRFAPIAQAFIDAMFADSALGNAKALKKHANDNPVLVRRATRFFRQLSRKEAQNFAELFAKEAKE